MVSPNSGKRPEEKGSHFDIWRNVRLKGQTWLKNFGGKKFKIWGQKS